MGFTLYLDGLPFQEWQTRLYMQMSIDWQISAAALLSCGEDSVIKYRSLDMRTVRSVGVAKICFETYLVYRFN